MKGVSVSKIIFWVVFGVCAAAAVGLLLGIVVMSLWNWLMPEIFGLPEIGYWQAVGLFILCHLLRLARAATQPSVSNIRISQPNRRVKIIQICLISAIMPT